MRIPLTIGHKICYFVKGWYQTDVGGRQEQTGRPMVDDTQQTTETQRPGPLLDGDSKAFFKLTYCQQYMMREETVTGSGIKLNRN